MSNIRNEIKKKWPITVINISRQSIIGEIELLREYNIEQEELFEKQLIKFNRWADEQTKDLDEEGKEGFYEHYGEDYWKINEVFPNLFRYSYFITAFSFFEYQLIDLCRLIKRQFDIKLNVSDIRGDEINKAQIYIKKVIGINFPDQSNSWNNIIKIKTIRNLIVHSLGRVDVLEENKLNMLKEYVERNQTLLKIDDIDKIILSKPFIDFVLDTFTSFYNELYDACDTWMEEKIN
jgi:hypothetical protein